VGLEIILLIGIVKKNGIMLVDFAIQAEQTDGPYTGAIDLPGLYQSVSAPSS